MGCMLVKPCSRLGVVLIIYEIFISRERIWLLIEDHPKGVMG